MKTHVLEALFDVIESRKGADAAQSYTAQLLAGGVALQARKLGEEAQETVIAALQGNREQIAAESADLLYHLLVLWAGTGVRPQDVFAALEARQGTSGIAEKEGRKK